MPEVNVHNISMYYEVSGEGKPVVLLHGLGSTADRNWYHVPGRSTWESGSGCSSHA